MCVCVCVIHMASMRDCQYPAIRRAFGPVCLTNGKRKRKVTLSTGREFIVLSLYSVAGKWKKFSGLAQLIRL